MFFCLNKYCCLLLPELSNTVSLNTVCSYQLPSYSFSFTRLPSRFLSIRTINTLLLLLLGIWTILVFILSSPAPSWSTLFFFFLLVLACTTHRSTSVVLAPRHTTENTKKTLMTLARLHLLHDYIRLSISIPHDYYLGPGSCASCDLIWTRFCSSLVFWSKSAFWVRLPCARAKILANLRVDVALEPPYRLWGENATQHNQSIHHQAHDQSEHQHIV